MIKIGIEAARKAGNFLKANVGKIRTIERKGGEERNLVTEIDKGSEEIIIQTIKNHFPAHGFLGEESGTKHAADSEYKWIIDPLDGTTNYTHALPVFCVSIGLERNGKIIAGIIYDPNLDEMFTAEKGKGAYVNGKKISVSTVTGLKNSLLVTGFPYNISQNPNLAIERFVTFLLQAQAVRRMGSAAIDLAYVAAGRYDGFWEVALNPWDVAAGAVILQEAGGTITDFSGKNSGIYSKEILASNGLVHAEMISLFAKVREQKIKLNDTGG